MGIRAWKGFLLGLVMCATGTCGGEGMRLEGQMRSKTIVCDNKNHTYLLGVYIFIDGTVKRLCRFASLVANGPIFKGVVGHVMLNIIDRLRCGWHPYTVVRCTHMMETHRCCSWATAQGARWAWEQRTTFVRCHKV